MGCNMEVVDTNLKKLFKFLGYQIGQRPGYFIIIPVLLTALAATGFQQIFYEADPEYLFSPRDGESKYERSVLESYFPTNYSQFDPGRISRSGRFGRVIITAQDGESLFRTHVWNEIQSLDNLIQNLSFYYNDELLTYNDICASYNSECWSNEILSLTEHMTLIEARETKVTFPLWFDPLSFKRYTFPFFVGGVSIDNDATITFVKAASLLYFLDSGSPEYQKRGSMWEMEFLDKVSKANFTYINVYRFSSLTLEIELESNTDSIVPYFVVNLGIMIAFCIITCMMSDWVKSKPLLGLLGVISAIMGTIVSFGLVIYCGCPFIGINLAAPFLMLGIGIDDTFVMLGAWRRTSVHDSIKDRMAQTYNDSAVSITITSITDLLSFLIGIITPFPCVQIFCIYTGVCVCMTYFWHITFFGGCMAISGYAEQQNRHSLTCRKVIPRSQSSKKSWLYRLFCSGGINLEDPFNKKDNSENSIMIFFRDYFAAALNNFWIKILIMILFFIYVGVSAWGVSILKEGLERRNLARFDSYSTDYYDAEDKYFRDYPYRVNVVISGRLDYSDPEVQESMMDLIRQFENMTYIEGLYTESWQRDFLSYVNRNKDYMNINISSETAFISSLKEIYIDSGSGHVSEDVQFSPDGQSIIASRFLIQGSNIRNANEEKKFVEDLREICHASKYNVTVFHPYFIFFDQFLLVLPTTIQCVAVAAIVMMVVSLIFIPNPICSLWVAFSIISIELGVVGFMAIWGVSLDSITMINLIMCIGFSVDFSAHISYHFMSHAKEFTSEERVVDSMYALGLPILQGAISTILGVLGLAIAPSYIFITFFKMVFLVILLGALHGLLLLPVLLSVFGPGACSSKTKSDTSSSSSSSSRLTDGIEINLKIPRPCTTPTTSIDKKRNSLRGVYKNKGYESDEKYSFVDIPLDQKNRRYCIYK